MEHAFIWRMLQQVNQALGDSELGLPGIIFVLGLKYVSMLVLFLARPKTVPLDFDRAVGRLA